jgi:lipopolysaccharide transport system ATP-binding protein
VGALLEVGTGFHPELSGRENIFLNGAILGMRRAEIRKHFDEIVAFAEIEQFIDTPAKHYSTGMYMRLAFAVAAYLQPDILLVDEVLAVGDAAFQKKCLGKMGEVAKQGRTVLFVSHNMAAVQRLCGTALLLEGGRITARGTAREVVGRYLAGDNRPRYLAPVRSGGPQILVVELTVSGPAGRPLNTDAIGFHITYVLPARTPGVQIGIGVLSADGESLFTSRPADEDLPVPSDPGEHQATVTLPPQALLAGDFGLAVCLWNDAEILDLQEPALGFSVEPGPSVLYRSTTTRKGHVHIPCAWQVGVSGPVARGAR